MSETIRSLTEKNRRLSSACDVVGQENRELFRLNQTLESANAALKAENERLTLKCEEWEMRLQSESEHTAYLETQTAALREALSDATKWNHAVPVCAPHTKDLTDRDGCVICDEAALRQRCGVLEGALREILTHGVVPDRASGSYGLGYDNGWNKAIIVCHNIARAALSTPGEEVVK